MRGERAPDGHCAGRRGPAFRGRGCPGRLLRMWDLALRDPPCVASATGRRGAKAPPAPHGRALLPRGAAPHSFTRRPAGRRRVVAIPRAHVRVCVLGRWSLLCSWAHSGQRSCRVPRWSRSSPWGETARRAGVCISSCPRADGDLTPGCDPPGECPLSSDPARLLHAQGPTSMWVTLDPGPSRSVRRAALRPGPGPGPCRQHPPLPGAAECRPRPGRARGAGPPGCGPHGRPATTTMPAARCRGQVVSSGCCPLARLSASPSAPFVPLKNPKSFACFGS